MAESEELSASDLRGMVFTGEMYGVQFDQLAMFLGVSVNTARTRANRWRQAGYARTDRLSRGPGWVWLTGSGLAACGLGHLTKQPVLFQVAHTRAVTSVRLALAATGSYQRAGAFWVSERQLKAGHRIGGGDHVPDGEVHWPAGADVPWAGECWAIEAELSRKTVKRTALIMQQVLLRPGTTRVVYVCSPSAVSTVARARASLGSLAARVEIRSLP